MHYRKNYIKKENEKVCNNLIMSKVNKIQQNIDQFRISTCTVLPNNERSTIMSDLRNPINRTNTVNPAGNVMKEMQEAELSRITAGAGEARISGGVVCTATAECYYGTYLSKCCPNS